MRIFGTICTDDLECSEFSVPKRLAWISKVEGRVVSPCNPDWCCHASTSCCTSTAPLGFAGRECRGAGIQRGQTMPESITLKALSQACRDSQRLSTTSGWSCGPRKTKYSTISCCCAGDCQPVCIVRHCISCQRCSTLRECLIRAHSRLKAGPKRPECSLASVATAAGPRSEALVQSRDRKAALL